MARIFSILLVAAATVLAGAVASRARPSADERGFDTVSIPLIAEGKPDAADSAVAGYLFLPTGGGPFPAVVIMHGCNGLDWLVSGTPGWALFKRYAARYVAHGYAALVLDSFEPRGLGNICGNPTAVTPQRRAWDALSAARWLGARRDIDKRRLVLQGDSHGGWTVLVALDTRRAPAPVPFAAGIAFYPYCPEGASGFSAPLLVLIGGRDDWTPASRCSTMVTRLQRRSGSAVELKIFPSATHAYDFPLPARTNRLGHFMTYDAAATEASWQAIDAFLAAHVK
ncbi:MAG TPA: dienelactone hydrolase family protein [Stellaceae bacterium]|nr:dienelactone hydrolase family protein [Stellaceae bacterium]